MWATRRVFVRGDSTAPSPTPSRGPAPTSRAWRAPCAYWALAGHDPFFGLTKPARGRALRDALGNHARGRVARVARIVMQSKTGSVAACSRARSVRRDCTEKRDRGPFAYGGAPWRPIIQGEPSRARARGARICQRNQSSRSPGIGSPPVCKDQIWPFRVATERTPFVCRARRTDAQETPWRFAASFTTGTYAGPFLSHAKRNSSALRSRSILDLLLISFPVSNGGAVARTGLARRRMKTEGRPPGSPRGPFA